MSVRPLRFLRTDGVHNYSPRLKPHGSAVRGLSMYITDDGQWVVRKRTQGWEIVSITGQFDHPFHLACIAAGIYGVYFPHRIDAVNALQTIVVAEMVNE